jgi:hypothetical protein
MADQENPKKQWTKPVLRRLDGEEAERMRAFLLERSGMSPSSFVQRKAQSG